MDWLRLERLRDLFLRGDKSTDYWRDQADLAAYDAIYARRIEWKWAAVLAELAERGYRPSTGKVIDWGCGSGAASRSVLEAFAIESPRVTYWDRSTLARNFAAGRAGEGVETEVAPSDPLFGGTPQTSTSVVVMSHVINEVSPGDWPRILTALARAAEILWVEPGSKVESRKLSELRSKLLPTHDLLGPCLHAQKCGLLRDEFENDWCHRFATPPAEAFTSEKWTEASRRLGFDLRSLPYSYLALRRKDLARPLISAPLESGTHGHRLLGSARASKGYVRIQTCEDTGAIRDLRLQKRNDAQLFKRIEKERLDSPFLRLKTEEDEVLEGAPLIDNSGASN